MQIGSDGGGALTVLGQVYRTTAQTAGSVAVGDYVIAAGDNAGNLGVLYPLDASYVAGASPVSVVGLVSGADPAVGNLTIGGAVIDYSAYLATDPGYTPAADTILQARGTQPVPGGQIIISSGPSASSDASTFGLE